jgi:uncharacterized membrane protein
MGLFLAPVAFHRVVFQERLRDRMVPIADQLASIGLLFLIAAVGGALLLALDTVMGRGAAVALVLGVVTITALLWYALPAWIRQTT